MTIRWMNFTDIKERASFEFILDRYGIEYPRAEGQVLIRCPFHDDTRPSFSISFEQKLFHCFSCDARGDILDFVAKMDDVSIPEAARIVSAYSGMPLERMESVNILPNRTKPCRANTPLGFTLTLDQKHPYLFERGLTAEVIEHFGIGYCDAGVLQGRIAIPIHDAGGQLVAYAGRWASDNVPEGTAKYLLPRGFQKRKVLFNYHRVAPEPYLLIVEGYWSVFRLHALGPIPAIALMGRTLSEEHEELLEQTAAKMLTLVLDGDQPGRTATEDLLSRLSSRFFVKATRLPDGESPDTVDAKVLLDAVSLP